MTIDEKFNKKFGKLFDEYQIRENLEERWKYYPQNEAIKEFFKQEMKELIGKIEISEDYSGIELEKEADKFGVPVSAYAIRKLDVVKEEVSNKYIK